MNFDFLQKLITESAIDTLQDVYWVKSELKLTFTFPDTSGASFSYYNTDGQKVAPYFIDNEGRKRIKEIKSRREIQELLSYYCNDCQKNVDTKWNVAIFTIYPNKDYKSEFIWDNDYYIQNEIKLSKASVTILYERFYEVLSFDILPDINWGQAEVKSSIINGSIAHRAYTLNKEFDLKLPEKWEKYLLNLHSKTNEEDADSYWGRWDTVTIQMRYEDNFSFDKDVQFSLMAKS